MPIVNPSEDGGMQPIEHLMRHIGFRYDSTGTTYEFPNHPDDRLMKEFMVREIYFKKYPGAWIAEDGTKVRQGSDASPMTARNYDNVTLSRMSMRGLQDIAKEIGAPVLSDFDGQIQAITRQQKMLELGIAIPGVTVEEGDKEGDKEGDEEVVGSDTIDAPKTPKAPKTPRAPKTN